MGSVKNLSHNKFPKQSKYVGKAIEVCFNYDTTNMVHGIIIRDDIEEPNETLILLPDGRCIRSTECQYNLPINLAQQRHSVIIPLLKPSEDE